jgi:hypothetical protein
MVRPGEVVDGKGNEPIATLSSCCCGFLKEALKYVPVIDRTLHRFVVVRNVREAVLEEGKCIGAEKVVPSFSRNLLAYAE